MQDYMKNTGVYATSRNTWKITDGKPHTHTTHRICKLAAPALARFGYDNITFCICSCKVVLG